MKKFLWTLAAFLIALPAFAADQPADAVTPVIDQAAVEIEAEEAPATDVTPDATPEELLEDLLAPEATAQQSGCCTGARNACEANCNPEGIFEFSCDPDTCSSSCICNLS